jgi:hypothetical protein
MFAKVFEQIFDSSIAEDWKVRLVFEDLLILADINGVVDKTPEAISRRTNVPLDVVQQAISVLESPDHRSRRPDNEGRRIQRLDDHREWGWFIVNYDYYRKIASEEQRREKTKKRVQKLREKSACNASVTHSNARVTLCNDSPSASVSASVSPSEKERVCVRETEKRQNICDSWNSIAKQAGLAEISKITDERLKKYHKRLESFPNFWDILKRELPLLGEFARGSGSWKLDFDFCIHSDDNVTKISEGKYRDNKKQCADPTQGAH